MRSSRSSVAAVVVLEYLVALFGAGWWGMEALGGGALLEEFLTGHGL